jgi:hypothetical protein
LTFTKAYERERKENLMGWKIEMAMFFNFIIFHSIFCQTNMNVYGTVGERGLSLDGEPMEPIGGDNEPIGGGGRRRLRRRSRSGRGTFTPPVNAAACAAGADGEYFPIRGTGKLSRWSRSGKGGCPRLRRPSRSGEGDFYAAGDDSYAEPNWEKFPLTFTNAYEREKRKSYGVEEMK